MSPLDDKFDTLAALVKEARIEDARTFAILQDATAAWKAANAVLTDRHKVFDGYVDQMKKEALA